MTTTLRTQTWTFLGHWDNDRIVIEHILRGDVPDDRDDTGQWEQGLWSETATGTDLDTVKAAVINAAEAEHHDEA